MQGLNEPPQGTPSINRVGEGERVSCAPKPLLCAVRTNYGYFGTLQWVDGYMDGWVDGWMGTLVGSLRYIGIWHGRLMLGGQGGGFEVGLFGGFGAGVEREREGRGGGGVEGADWGGFGGEGGLVGEEELVLVGVGEGEKDELEAGVGGEGVDEEVGEEARLGGVEDGVGGGVEVAEYYRCCSRCIKVKGGRLTTAFHSTVHHLYCTQHRKLCLTNP